MIKVMKALQAEMVIMEAVINSFSLSKIKTQVSTGLIFGLIVFSPLPVLSQIFMSENGHAEFQSSVPLHTFTGKSEHLTGMIDFNENIVDFYLDLSTLKTGNSRRDRDMYRTLNIEEFPFAEFTGSLDTPVDFDTNQEQQVITTGTFTMHGIAVEKTVEGTIEVQRNSLVLKAEWVQDITDHNIEPPGILFYRVRDEMDVQIEIVLEPTDND